MRANWKIIKEIAKQIADRFHPDKVLLVGSYAYGSPNKNSDVDLLVILPSKKRNAEQALEISRAIDHPFPMDLMTFTPQQVFQRVKGGDLILQEMLQKGKISYEAPRYRSGLIVT